MVRIVSANCARNLIFSTALCKDRGCALWRGTFKALALGTGREFTGVFGADKAAAEAHHGRLEAEAGPGAGFIEERGHDETAEHLSLLIPGFNALHLLRDEEELLQHLLVELL
jgi:hypothetical protein